MKISIAARLRPFSHEPGVKVLVPGTEHVAQVFPTRIHIAGRELILIEKGPLKNFTVTQDLERECITIFTDAYSYHLLPSLELTKKRPIIVEHERLAMGIHKKPEWEQVRRRADFREIFPIWLRLGQLLQLPEVKIEPVGMFTLLQGCEQAIEAHRPEKILAEFQKLFLAGFHHQMVPRTFDDQYQGIAPEGESDLSPFYLLQEGARLIRSLFVNTTEKGVHFLPNLPPEFFSGRMTHIPFSLGHLDFEWSKKQLRRVHLHAERSGQLQLRFPPALKRFRFQKHFVSCGEAIEINSDTTYLLDQFQK